MADRNGNENCLEGWECPRCKKADHFKVEAVRRLIVDLYDDGTDDRGGDTEWGNESYCECGSCGFSGTVNDFDAITCREEEVRQ